MDQNLSANQKKERSSPKLVKIVPVVILLAIMAGIVKTSVVTPDYGTTGYTMAPHPEDYKGPVIQVYAARTWGAKKALAVHTWIATKRQGDESYQVSQIIGWRLRRSGIALFSNLSIPDRGWHGNHPELLLDLRGPGVEGIIDKVDQAIENYPWSREYTVWPGPNSNTFTAWVGLQVPELGLDLPSTAIGKDWRPIKNIVGSSASGTGLQASVYGLFGASIGYEEGIEVNILGLNLELDLFDLAIELPGFGRIGFPAVQTKRP